MSANFLSILVDNTYWLMCSEFVLLLLELNCLNIDKEKQLSLGGVQFWYISENVLLCLWLYYLFCYLFLIKQLLYALVIKNIEYY